MHICQMPSHMAQHGLGFGGFGLAACSAIAGGRGGSDATAGPPSITRAATTASAALMACAVACATIRAAIRSRPINLLNLFTLLLLFH
jgi:hypothetical protein